MSAAKLSECSDMADEPKPPFYLLLAHSPLSNVPTGALSNTLGHPVIQYQYADDSPLSILPTHPDENVLVFNYHPTAAQPTVQSVSETLVVTGLKVEEAPGAAVDDSTSGDRRNNSMFIIETTTNDHLLLPQHGDRKAALATLAQFKHRNNLIRRALEYPADNAHTESIAPSDSPTTLTQPSSLDE